ncbi:hypothetical protein [Pseudopedobacter beijingensis]|uniref:LTXXQ motif family protein n=1 Tax=Pseudopedobacter beijingensis TaxID=1207056 RepID=A0ABW4IBL5_9SPHI
MKKVILSMLLAVGLSVYVNAQQAKKYNSLSIEAMEEINATAEQKQKFNELMKEFEEKKKEIRSNNVLSAEEKKTKMNELFRYRMKTYWDEILTPEQNKQLREKQRALKALSND